MARWLLGLQGSLQDLVVYLDSLGHTRQAEAPSAQLRTAMEQLCEGLGASLPVELSVRIRDNGITALLHWRCLLTIVSMLEPHQVASLKKQFGLSPEEAQQLPTLPKAFDSHCHLDRTMRDLDIKEQSLNAICRHQAARAPYEVKVERVVGVFCDPETYPTEEQVRRWKSK